MGCKVPVDLVEDQCQRTLAHGFLLYNRSNDLSLHMQICVILQELGLGHMGLEHIETGAFCGISEISKLNLNFNKLTSLPQLCTLKYRLVHLQIGYNKITRRSKNYLKGFRKLQNLKLSHNNLLVLPDLHWIQHSVSNLMANKNKLESLDALQTPGMYILLNNLTFFENNILNFNVSLLRHMPKLKILWLNGNEIAHIEDIRGFDIRLLNLRNKPWHCDEEFTFPWVGH